MDRGSSNKLFNKVIALLATSGDPETATTTGHTQPRHGRARTQETGSATMNVKMRLPKFWPADAEVWFGQVESQFIISRITNQSTRFHRVVATLPAEVAMGIRNLILKSKQKNACDVLRAVIIKRASTSEQ